jgi:hypothetical protein
MIDFFTVLGVSETVGVEGIAAMPRRRSVERSAERWSAPPAASVPASVAVGLAAAPAYPAGIASVCTFAPAGVYSSRKMGAVHVPSGETPSPTRRTMRLPGARKAGGVPRLPRAYSAKAASGAGGNVTPRKPVFVLASATRRHVSDVQKNS